MLDIEETCHETKVNNTDTATFANIDTEKVSICPEYPHFLIERKTDH